MEMSQVPRTSMSLLCQLISQIEGTEAALGVLPILVKPAFLPVNGYPRVVAHTTTKIAEAGGHKALPSAPCGQGSTHCAILFFSAAF